MLKLESIGVLFRLKSFWIGVHYSDHTKRFCINLIPCITIWVILKDGVVPQVYKKEKKWLST